MLLYNRLHSDLIDSILLRLNTTSKAQKMWDELGLDTCIDIKKVIGNALLSDWPLLIASLQHQLDDQCDCMIENLLDITAGLVIEQLAMEVNNIEPPK